MIRNSPERLAWLVLLLSFVTFCALAIGVPTAVYSYINNATYPAYAHIRLQAGKVLTLEPNASRPSFVDLNGFEVQEGSTITVEDDGQQSVGLLIFSTSATDGPFASLNLYSGSQVRILTARTPRFWRRSRPPQVEIEMLSGRAEIQVYEANDFHFELNSPHGRALLDEGLHMVEISNAANNTQLSVLRGSASAQSLITTTAHTMQFVAANNAAILSVGQAAKLIQPTPKNLVVNGNFRESIFDDKSQWTFAATTALPNDARGELSHARGMHETVVIFERTAFNAGSTSLTQNIDAVLEPNQPVKLLIEFAIFSQSLDVCGGQGSECPLMVKLVLQDKNGDQREWIQGFYVKGTPNAQLPDYVRSNTLLRHLKKRPGEREIFESANILMTMPQATTIKSLSIVAEGHSLKSQVYSVALLVDK